MDCPFRIWTVERVPQAANAAGVRSFVSTVPDGRYRNHDRFASPATGIWSGYVTAKDSRYSRNFALPAIAEPAEVGYGGVKALHVPSTGVTFPVRVLTETAASFPNAIRT